MKKKIIRCVRPKPMAIVALKPQEAFYDKDFYKWTHEQKKALKAQDLERVDIENLVEEIDSLGKSVKHALSSHLRNLLMHLLKAQVQPVTRSWQSSIKNAQLEIAEILEESPSLKRQLSELIQKQYRGARELAALETGVDLKKFPKECPWSREEILK